MRVITRVPNAQVELWDVRGAAPAVRSVALEADGAAPTAVDLGDALPLAALLAPVSAAKERIAAALDLLEPAPPGAHASGAISCHFMEGVPGAQPSRAL